MKGINCDWLPLLLALAATALALQQADLLHATCDNEERYENQMMCKGKQFGCLVPYPDNCSLFLVCDCIYPTVKECPGKLLWDNNTQVCNYAQVTDCIFYEFTTPNPDPYPKPTTTPVQTTTEQNWPTSSYDPPPYVDVNFCRQFPAGSPLVHRYPYNCNAYINCTTGWPVLNYCDPDKVFNEILRICDTPDTAECEPLPLPNTTTTIEPTTTTTIAPTTTTTFAPTTTTTIAPTTTTPEDEECGAPPLGIEEDYCWGLGNGYYVYPYACDAYLSCRNGCTHLNYCIPDKLFNPILHICDTPNSVTCNPQPFPTTSTAGPTGVTSTTESPTDTTTVTAPPTLPPDVNPDECIGYPDDTRLPYAGNCSQYLLCRNNEVTLGQCPNDLLYNPDLSICDDPDHVYCYGDRTTSTTSTTPEPTTVEITTTTPAGPAELCQNQPQGESYPYVQDCSQYILCLGNGAYYIAPCAGGYYDPVSKACGPNVSPTACKESETTTAAPITTTEVDFPTTTTRATTSPRPDEPTGICGGEDQGKVIAYPKDCSKYIVCVSPIPVAFYCVEGFYFSSKAEQCVSWAESDCDKEISTTTPGYTTVTPAPEPTICTDRIRDTFPYPGNCQWYIRCVNDYVYMMGICDYGEYYDPIREECGADVPHDACRWEYNTTTTPQTTTESTTAGTRPPDQKGPCDDTEDGELVPYPNDCSKYIACTRPIPSAFECPEGEEFSPEARECMDASLANCYPGTTPYYPSTTDVSTTTPVTPSTPGTVTTPVTPSTPGTVTTPVTPSTPGTVTTPVTTTTTDTPTTEDTMTTTTEAPPSGICGGKPLGSLVPYPNNCDKYIVCDEPIPIGYDCPDGLEFSPLELKCMDPELANCRPNPTPGTSTTPPWWITTTTVSTTEEPCITPTVSTTEEPSTTTSPPTDTTTDSTTEQPCTSTPTPTKTTTTESTTEEPSTTTSPPTDTTIPVSTTDSTTDQPCTSTPTPTETTTETTIIDTTTTSTTEEPSTTTTPEVIPTVHPDTPNICCGVPLGTILPYPNDCNRYVVCDYPIPFAVICKQGTAFDPNTLQCTEQAADYCPY